MGCITSAGLYHTHSLTAPTSPVGGDAAAAAAAGRAVEAEGRALRCARCAYQRAALDQQDLCTSVVRTIHEALKQSEAPGSPAPALRPRSADVGIQAIRRRKWRRDLTAELQGLCSGAAACKATGL